MRGTLWSRSSLQLRHIMIHFLLGRVKQILIKNIVWFLLGYRLWLITKFFEEMLEIIILYLSSSLFILRRIIHTIQRLMYARHNIICSLVLFEHGVTNVSSNYIHFSTCFTSSLYSAKSDRLLDVHSEYGNCPKCAQPNIYAICNVSSWRPCTGHYICMWTLCVFCCDYESP